MTFNERKIISSRFSAIKKDQRGFTLTELLVAAGLSLFVLASIGSLFRAQTKTVKGQESRMEASEYALTVLEMVVREIRNAGYFPAAACDATGGITAATATSIALQYDRNGDGVCTGVDEIITFNFDGANVTRTTTNPATTSLLTNGNATALTFTYFPQQTAAAAPPPYCVTPGVPLGCNGALALSLTSVQRITVSLTVAPTSTDVQFAGAAVTMSATADLRNHGT
jgi:prepilin-type N-terminal cleavage/methylation domain-containing protein